MGDAFLRRGGAAFAALNLLRAPYRTEYVAGERPDLSGIACEALIGATALTVGAETVTAMPDRPLNAGDTEIYACLDIGGAQRFVTVPVTVTAPSATFGENSWSLIAGACAAGMAKDLWSAGDTKTFTDRLGNAHTARIIAFDHDALHPDDALYGGGYNGGGRVCALTLALGVFSADMSGSGTGVKMNDTGTNADGWRASLMRAKTMADAMAALPDDLRGALRLTEKRTGAGKRSSALNLTGDRVFLCSEIEHGGAADNSAPGEGTAYNAQGVFEAILLGALLEKGAGQQYVNCWMRSPDRLSNDSFVYMRVKGTVTETGGVRSVEPGTLRYSTGVYTAGANENFIPMACL